MQKIKRFCIRFLAILLAVQGTVAVWLLSPSAAYAAGTQEVVINEVMWTGTQADSQDEWIELYNTLPTTRSIAGWSLSNVLTSNGTYTFPEGTTIPGNGYLLIGRNTTPTARTVALDIAISNFALVTTCSTIELKDVVSVLVDQMGCSGSTYFFPTSPTTRHALERNVVVANGLDQSSWHERTTGFANIDSITYPLTLATPKVANDVTAPTVGEVEDEGEFTANSAELTANWTGFADEESGVVSYLVGLGTTPGNDDVVNFTPITASSHTFSGLSLVENQTYFFAVKAINTVSLESNLAFTDGITLNTSDPIGPTNLTVIDTPNDNGGSLTVSWNLSVSPDVESYEVSYREQGEIDWLSFDAGNVGETVVDGLENDPVIYEVTVEAIDFNGQFSNEDLTETGSARDNLAPILDVTKVTVGQNKPGNTDTISGQAGASNEGMVTVYVFDRDPSLTGSVLINSVVATGNGSFDLMGIGDNRFGVLWIQLVDAAGNASIARSFTNDIVAPNTPSLESVIANCIGDPCRVTFGWIDNGPDTANYRIRYTSDGVEKETLDLTGNTAVLDLPADHSYEFSVYAYDAFGNKSSNSNMMNIRLTPGVKTTASLQGGIQVTNTEAIDGAREVYSSKGGATSLNGYIVPPAKAADGEDGNGSNQGADDSGQNGLTDEDQSQNWLRILVVVLLLLVIAGSFYALSRSMKEPSAPTVVAETETKRRNAGTKSKKGSASRAGRKPSGKR